MSITGRVLLDGFFAESYPFKNFFKLYTNIQASGSYAFPEHLTSDGYPTGTLSSAILGTIQLPTSYTGNWRIYWQGTLNILLSPTQTPNTGFTIIADPSSVATAGGTTMSINATSGTYVDFKFNGVASSLLVQFNTAFNFSGTAGLVLCRTSSPYTGDQTAIDGGVLTEQFNDDFITNLTRLNVKVIRPLRFNNPDEGGNITQYATRTPTTALSYFTPLWDPGSIATNGGSGMKTSNVGDAYTISSYPNMPGSWTDGETIQVQWSATNTTATPTLNVGGRGAKAIMYLDGTTSITGYLVANQLVTLIYDAVIGKLILGYSGGVYGNSVPWELLCALANKLNTHLWINIPTHFTLASVQSLAALIRDNLSSSLNCYIEYSNEVWNTSASFEQSGWAIAYGAALGFPNANNERYHGTYGLKVAQFMPAIATVWTAGGRSRSTLKCILAFQAAGDTSTTQTYRLNGTDLNTSLGYAGYNSFVGVNYNSSPNRPVDVCDGLSYATYYSGAQCANFDGNYSNAGGTGLTTGGPSGWTTGLLGAADAYAAGGSTNIANAYAFLDWDISQGTNNGAAGSETLLALKSGHSGVGYYPAWETVAASYDATRSARLTVDCYEGGSESNYPSTSRCTALGISTTYGGSTGLIANMLTGYKNSSNFQALVTQQFNDFMTSSHSTTPAWFIYDGAALQWSLFPGDLYTTPFKSWDAIAAFDLVASGSDGIIGLASTEW